MLLFNGGWQPAKGALTTRAIFSIPIVVLKVNTRRVRHTSRCTSGEGVVSSAIAPVALKSFKNVTIALKTQPNALNCDNVQSILLG